MLLGASPAHRPPFPAYLLVSPCGLVSRLHPGLFSSPPTLTLLLMCADSCRGCPPSIPPPVPGFTQPALLSPSRRPAGSPGRPQASSLAASCFLTGQTSGLLDPACAYAAPALGLHWL